MVLAGSDDFRELTKVSSAEAVAVCEANFGIEPKLASELSFRM
jgi:hypothetical protein